MPLSNIQILSLAKQASANSHSPYSKFKVGAALLAKDGTFFLGANVENVSYPVSICAERAALSAAVTNGKKEFTKLAVVASGNTSLSPCGVCRQALAEFAIDLEVICANYTQLTKGEFDFYKLSSLLPKAFLKF